MRLLTVLSFLAVLAMSGQSQTLLLYDTTYASYQDEWVYAGHKELTYLPDGKLQKELHYSYDFIREETLLDRSHEWRFDDWGHLTEEIEVHFTYLERDDLLQISESATRQAMEYDERGDLSFLLYESYFSENGTIQTGYAQRTYFFRDERGCLLERMSEKNLALPFEEWEPARKTVYLRDENCRELEHQEYAGSGLPGDWQLERTLISDYNEVGQLSYTLETDQSGHPVEEVHRKWRATDFGEELEELITDFQTHRQTREIKQFDKEGRLLDIRKDARKHGFHHPWRLQARHQWHYSDQGILTGESFREDWSIENGAWLNGWDEYRTFDQDGQMIQDTMYYFSYLATDAGLRPEVRYEYRNEYDNRCDGLNVSKTMHWEDDYLFFGEQLSAPSTVRNQYAYSEPDPCDDLAVGMSTDLSILPNPATTSVTIRSPFLEKAGVTLQVIDGQGRLVLERAASIGSTMFLQLPDLPAGMYLIRLVRDEQYLARPLLVIPE
jgi:hypothetical protein